MTVETVANNPQSWPSDGNNLLCLLRITKRHLQISMHLQTYSQRYSYRPADVFDETQKVHLISVTRKILVVFKHIRTYAVLVFNNDTIGIQVKEGRLALVLTDSSQRLQFARWFDLNRLQTGSRNGHSHQNLNNENIIILITNLCLISQWSLTGNWLKCRISRRAQRSTYVEMRTCLQVRVKRKKKKKDVEVKRNAIGRVDHVEYTGLWLAN